MSKNDTSTLSVAVTTDVAKKMSVTRFLQVSPQKSGIAAIMKRKYASEVHTLEEWEQIVIEVRTKQVK